MDSPYLRERYFFFLKIEYTRLESSSGDAPINIQQT